MSQIAEKKFPHAMLLGGLSVNLNHLKSQWPILPMEINTEPSNQENSEFTKKTQTYKERSEWYLVMKY